MRAKVDLTAYLNEGEFNFARLSRLLPEDFFEKEIPNTLPLRLATHHGIYADLDIELVEKSVYTSMLNLHYRFGQAFNELSNLNYSQVVQNLRTFESCDFEVRLYHDVRLLEIMSFQQAKNIKISYPYPNHKMHQPDEKLQQQRFLTLCLQMALSDAVSNDMDNNIQAAMRQLEVISRHK